ncbi:PIG-L family deacetylase [Paracoccus sp. YLB-12]|uniref:PIG-L family deacetylase n=1 Tax=Paracoccus maritimus TaxID=2933292 RepID=A0ABT2KAY2_9RHOB|nr:PIG-L family deacetylase [Paracoccus sp. YLB-12]MCT4333149.1 PIG-L family deacetylase [Paracoccus sp. YLB-12]
MIVFTSLVGQTRDAPAVGISELAGSGDVLVLAPHPDDESLAMGGAIAAASATGRRIHVAVVTDGARSHPNSKSHPPDRLRALRRREVGLAVKILTEGSGVVHWLGYPDMAAPDNQACFAEVETALAPVFADVTAIWTTWNGDPHPDHQRVWRLAQWLTHRHCGVRMFACPVWGRVQRPVAGCGWQGARRFRSQEHRGTKSRAVFAHASQMTDLIRDDPDGFRMPQALARHFIVSDEIFIPS